MTAGVYQAPRFILPAILFVLFALVMTPFSVRAEGDQGAAAQKFIAGMAQDALDFLKDDSLSGEEKSGKFRQLLQSRYDMDTIGRFALGRYWNVATPDQRTEYQKLFREMIVRVYSNRFKDYKGQKFETRSHRADGGKDTLVSSFIVPTDGAAEVQVDWRVRQTGGGFKVVDVVVEGVSMSVTQRSDFASVIQRGGGNVSVLIDYLKKNQEESKK